MERTHAIDHSTRTRSRRRRARARAGSGVLTARWRLLLRGSDGLSDADLLALCVGSRTSAESFALASRLISKHGTVAGVFAASPADLLEEAGLGPAGVARLVAASALIERALAERLHAAPVIGGSDTLRRYLRLKLGGAQREIFACLFLDSRHRLIAFEPLFLGTVDRASVHPREVLRRALGLNAAALILAHNHPSGVAEPSASDLELTRDLCALLARIDVRVLDHLVIGRGEEVSFAERGWL